jgi:hypothetical protein
MVTKRISDKTFCSHMWVAAPRLDKGPCCRCVEVVATIKWYPEGEGNTTWLITADCPAFDIAGHEDCCALCEACGKLLGLEW